VPAVFPGENETSNQRQAEVDPRAVPGIECAGKLRRNGLAEYGALGRYRGKKLADDYRRDISSEKNSEPRGDTRRVALYRYGAPFPELCSNSEWRSTVSRRSMVPGRGREPQMMLR
jgi:hypothetical protein